MAHRIETHGTQAAAIFAREDAWHKLGTTVAQQAFTAEEAMTLGHLGGWNVRKTPLTTAEITDDGVTQLDVPNAYATIRTNPFTGTSEPLGVVGSAYQPIQNEEHADFLNTLADASGATFDTAGSLCGGRQTFITMKLPESITIAGVDQIDVYLAALNSHDGSSAFRILVTPVRVVCANTQAAALANHRASWAIRHTTNAKAAITQARNALGMTFAYVDAFEAEADKMIQTSYTDAEFAALVATLYGTPDPDASTRARNTARERTDCLQQLYHHAATQAGIRGTRWGAYQTITEYVDHFAPVRAKGDKAAARATRLLTSDEPTRLKTRAFELLSV